MSLFSFLKKWRNTKHLPDNNFDLFIFGLGNPGLTYHYTRHNIGFRVLDIINNSLTVKKNISTSYCTIISGKNSKGHSIVTIRPQTFMNNSGEGVVEFVNQFNIDLTKILIIVDDFNIPLGTIRFRRNGSHGGHNGLKSIISAIGVDFTRLRIGIGPLPDNCSVIDFVLGNFLKHEESVLSSLFLVIQEALDDYITEPLETIMNKYNNHPVLSISDKT